MRIQIIAATMIIAIGSSLAGSKTPLTDRCPKTTPEARGLRAVECPALWPPGGGVSLKSAEFWDLDISPGPPLCWESGKEGEIDITGLIGPSDLECTYTNGTRLLISVPGTPVECRESGRKRRKAGDLDYRLACYFRPTGDRAKDESKIAELENLTRASEFFGLHLGMTRPEVEQALNNQKAEINTSGDRQIAATLPDGKEITAFRAQNGRVKEIEILATANGDNLYPAVKRRFGIPEPGLSEAYHAHWSFWTGKHHVRLDAIPLKKDDMDIQRLRLIDLDQAE